MINHERHSQLRQAQQDCPYTLPKVRPSQLPRASWQVQRVRISSRKDKKGSMALEACQPFSPPLHKAEAPEAEDEILRQGYSKDKITMPKIRLSKSDKLILKAKKQRKKSRRFCPVCKSTDVVLDARMEMIWYRCRKCSHSAASFPEKAMF